MAKRLLIFILLFVGMFLWTVGKTAVLGATPSDDTIDNPIIAIEKTTTTPEIAKGDTALFVITVTNSGDVPLTDVTVVDELTPDCNASFGTMQPSDVQVYNCEQTSVEKSFNNTAVASGRAPNGVVVSDQDYAFIKVENLEISISKDTITPIVRRNGTAQFTITIINDSDTHSLLNVEVVDELAPNCDRNIGTLPPKEFFNYTCTLPNVQKAFSNVAVVTAVQPTSGVVEASDSAEIEVLDLEMEFMANPSTLPEPGNAIDFTAKITNTGSLDLQLNSLISSRFGDLMDSSNGNVTDNSCPSSDTLPQLVANGGEYVCEFTAVITGQPQVVSLDLMATADDDNDDGIDVSETANLAVNLTNLPSSIELDLNASQTNVPSPGGTVDFTVTVHNSSEVDSVVINSLVSNTLGSLRDEGDCELPQTIDAGNDYICTYSIEMTGTAGKQVKQEVTATGQDDDITPNNVTDRDSVNILITAPTTQYLPMAPKLYRFVDEPNDSCQTAYPVFPDQTYNFAAEDSTDWYQFELLESQAVVVEVKNFTPQDGQVVVYVWDGVNCEPSGQGGTRVLIGNNGNFGSNKSVNLGELDAGYYLIRVINDGTPTQTKYSLKVNVS